MSKRARQYIGILAAGVVYYLVHEGAHLLYALFVGVFKQINFMGIGVQIDVYAGRMSEAQLGVFCLAGAAGNVLRRVCFGRTCGQNMLRKEQTAPRNALLYNDCIFTA